VILGGGCVRKAAFLIGFGAGYVLGTKAGRERYEAIARSTRRLLENPAVQETAGLLQAQAAGLIDQARQVLVGSLHRRVEQFGGASAPETIHLPEPAYSHNGHAS
jgi:hypothetical protein